MRVSRVHAPVRHQTTQNIRNAIIEGIFRPGDRLIERELCELTGVSRTIIREALRQLEAEGIVKTIPNKGPFVATLTIEEAKDIYQVRQVLECFACRLCAERASPSQISDLSHAVKTLEEVSSIGDTKKYIEAKTTFYDVILKSCGNKLIYLIIGLLHTRITYLRSMSLSLPGRVDKSLAEIKQISEAIERRDPDVACTACEEHIKNAEAVALKVLRTMNDDK